MASERYETGLRIRKEVLGEEHVERALAGADDFNREFQELVTEYCWGASWGGGRSHEFKLHFRAALGNGCSLDELKDTLLQIAIYCGVPAGVGAFRLAREVLDEDGIDPGGGA